MQLPSDGGGDQQVYIRGRTGYCISFEEEAQRGG